MNNVQVADKMVEAMQDFQKEFDTKPFVLFAHDDIEWYLKGLKRLRMLERNLLNMTSRAYDDKAE